MKNFKLLKQIDFSGGMDTETPDALSEETRLRRIVNMLPSDDGHALVLRGSFDNVPAMDLPTITGRVIGFLPFRGWVSDVETAQNSVYRSNEVLVAYEDGDDTVISRILPTGYYAADEELITKPQVWTEEGEDPDYGPGVDIIPPISYTTYIKNVATVLKAALTTAYNFMQDYWVDETSTDTYGDGSTGRMGANQNDWVGEDWSFSNDWDEYGWYEDWVSGITNDKRLFDLWSSESSSYAGTTVFETDDDGNPVFKFPFAYDVENTSVTGITQKVVRRPRVELLLSGLEEANIPHYLLFPKNNLDDEPHIMDDAIGFIVWVKRLSDYSDEEIDWKMMSKGTENLPIPLYPIDQDDITLESERYEEVQVSGVNYVKMSFRIPWAADTVVRIEGVQAGTVFVDVDFSGIVEKVGVE